VRVPSRCNSGSSSSYRALNSSARSSPKTRASSARMPPLQSISVP
jgi:hypothetical protein